MKYILTDIDDTVVRFGDAFQAWAEQRGLKTDGRLRDSCSIEQLLHCDPFTVDDLVTEFSTDPVAMGNIAPEPDAWRVIPTLYGMGYQFVAISSCVGGPEVTEIRRKNLEAAFNIPWLAIHCVGLHQPKVQILDAYERTYWVEDNAKHALAGAEMGHNTFLLERPYNAHHEFGEHGPKLVPNWHHVFEAVVRDELEAKRK